MTDVPQFFRLNVEVGDLERAISFYTALLGIEGRRDRGARCYFQCGAVTLQVVDVSASHEPHAAAKALSFTVKDLDAVFERARGLGCALGSGIAIQPWGERSFYAEDPWKNPL